jgi:hypothetical protein
MRRGTYRPLSAAASLHSELTTVSKPLNWPHIELLPAQSTIRWPMTVVWAALE